MWQVAAGCALAAILLYVNTWHADFAYDDSRAIIKNQDLRDETPLYNIWFDDYWGTPLLHSGSHKSYRPLVVLTFRLNYYLHQLSPGGYHLLNCILHSITCGLYVVLVALVAGRTFVTVAAGVLFAIHPIHTEAVAGIVGRADVLCAMFYIVTLLGYTRYCSLRSEGSLRRFGWLFATLLLTVAATLCKEIGITALGICLLYDVFHFVGLTLGDLRRMRKDKIKPLLEGAGFLFVFGSAILATRLYFMGFSPPAFSPADNPAADSNSLLTRTLTFLYLPLVNFYLLVFPATLSFDWSMDAIPLVESPFDPRFPLTVVFYASLALLVKHSLTYFCAAENVENRPTDSPTLTGVIKPPHPSGGLTTENGVNGCCHGDSELHRRFRRDSNSSAESLSDENHNLCGHGQSPSICMNSQSPSVLSHSRRHYSVTLLGLALTIVPFLPATNLFFYVGFVVAERVLYVPSMGFCLLVAELLHQLHKSVRRKPSQKVTFYSILVFVSFLLSLRTYSRCLDWRTEEALYRSGIAVNPAKAWGNLANVLNNQGDLVSAEQAYRNALSYRGNMADVHYNLGILLQDQRKYTEALAEYDLAIDCRPRLTVAHLNRAIVLAQLRRHAEAVKAYRHCVEIDTSGLKDPRMHETAKVSALYNLGRLYAESDDYKSAIEAYNEALQRRPDHYSPHSIYNLLGEAYFYLKEYDKAEAAYRRSLEAKPDHLPAHLTLARLMSKTNRTKEAEDWYEKAVRSNPTDQSARQHYAIFLMDSGRPADALTQWLQALSINPSDFDTVFNTASAYRQVGRNDEAEKYYLKSTKLQPTSSTAHMNLGAMYHLNKKYELAEKSYLRALQINPGDSVTDANLKKLRNIMHKRKR